MLYCVSVYDAIQKGADYFSDENILLYTTGKRKEDDNDVVFNLLRNENGVLF